MKSSKAWRLGTLNDITFFNPRRELKKGTIARFVTMDDVDPYTKSVARYATKKFSGGSKFINGDTLLARITPSLENGKTSFVNFLKEGEVGGGSTEFIVLAPKPDVDPEFLYYTAISAIVRDVAIRSMTGSSGRQRIQVDAVRGAEILIPPYVEQSRISKFLANLDAKSALNRRTSEIIEEIGRTLFKRWFVDFEFPNENGEPYRSSGGEMVDSALGEIPKGWLIKELREITTLIKGRSYKKDELQPSETALVNLKSFKRGGGYNPDGLKGYVGKFNTEQVIHPGEVAIALTDVTQNAEVIGGPALVMPDPNYKNLVASLDVGIVRPKHGIENSFVYYLLRSSAFKSHALSYTSGTTVLHLHKEAVPSFKFALPPEKQITKFTDFATQALKEISILHKEKTNLEQTRDLLLPKLLSGELVPTK